MAAKFNGIGALIRIGSPADLWAISGAMTLCAWIKSTASGGVIISAWDQSTGHKKIELRFFNGKIRIIVSSDGTSNTAWRNSLLPINDGEWHYVEGVFRPNTNLDVYIDVNLVNGDSSGTIPASLHTGGSADWGIGARNLGGVPAGHLEGYVSEAFIYNGYLSTVNRARLYYPKRKYAPKQVKAQDLICYWPMIDGPLESNADGVIFKDVSLNPSTKFYNGHNGIGDDGGIGGGLIFDEDPPLSYPGKAIYIPVIMGNGNGNGNGEPPLSISIASTGGWQLGNFHYKPGDLDFGGVTPNALDEVITAETESIPLDCSNKEYIVLHVEYEDGVVVASLGVALIGHNDSPARCPTITRSPTNKNRQTGALKPGYYLGETVIIPVEGAQQFIVVNETLLTQKVCVWATTI